MLDDDTTVNAINCIAQVNTAGQRDRHLVAA